MPWTVFILFVLPFLIVGGFALGYYVLGPMIYDRRRR